MAKGFQEDFMLIDTDSPGHATSFEHNVMGDMHAALVLGVKDYFHKSRNTKAVVGITGGLDSALVTALATKALGKENVLGVHLPSVLTTKENTEDARKLAASLGIEMHEIPIEGINGVIEESLAPYFDLQEDCATDENVIMRIRATILMAFANKNKALLLATGNKTEMAIGHCTLYGDMAGAITVIGDVVKTECYQLARYINKTSELIPQSILDKPTSDEVRHHEKDTHCLPGYEMIDRIIKGYVEDYKSPETISKTEDIDINVVMDVIRKIYKTEHKRRQAAPSLRISKKSFAVGRKKPLHYSGTTQEKIY